MPTWAKAAHAQIEDEILHPQVGKAVGDGSLMELSLADAPGAYASFDQRETGWTKVVLKPDRSHGS